MQKTRLSLAIFLLSLPLTLSAQENQAWGFGLEGEGRYHQPVITVDHGRYYTHEFPGSHHLQRVDFKLSASWEYRVWNPVWVGVRGSLGLFGMDGMVLPAPRANLMARWDVTDWISLGLEFPYNPGLSVLLFEHWYVFVGNNDPFQEEEDAYRSLALQYVQKF